MEHELIQNDEKEQIEHELGLNNKPLLTLNEAAKYYHIGVNRLRDITNKKCCQDYIMFCGRKRLIKREMFKNYLNTQFSV